MPISRKRGRIHVDGFVLDIGYAVKWVNAYEQEIQPSATTDNSRIQSVVIKMINVR